SRSMECPAPRMVATSLRSRAVSVTSRSRGAAVAVATAAGATACRARPIHHSWDWWPMDRAARAGADRAGERLVGAGVPAQMGERARLGAEEGGSDGLELTPGQLRVRV